MAGIHPVFHDGLKQALNREADLTVCGEAKDCNRALKEIHQLKPELALVAEPLPRTSGLEFIKKLRSKNRRLKLLVVSRHTNAGNADQVLRAGADGFILKQEHPEEIIHAIRDVLNGLIYVSDEVLGGTAKATPGTSTGVKNRTIDPLSDLELEVLELLGWGKSNQEIARQLGLSTRAVIARMTQMQLKLKLKSVNALIRHAVCRVERGRA
jgi:DNA-binding NarL/FixJ family response regulator